MEFVISDKVVASCNRTKTETSYITDHKKQAVDHELAKKLERLEFYRNELITHKSNLNQEMHRLAPFETRIQQTKNSLEYPKEITLKCLETREDRMGEDLCIDEVEKELKQELRCIEDTQIFLEDMLSQVREQMREFRAIAYSLEQDLQNKESALAVEKQNANIKVTDMCLSLNSNFIMEPSSFSKNSSSVNSNAPNWEQETEILMNKSKNSIKNGRQLRYRAEESLNVKTKDLTEQHESCNEEFQKRIIHYKNVKNIIEGKLSKLNEQILQMKQNMKELENAISEKEPFVNVAHIRLNNRIRTGRPELLGDDVESKLMKELQQLHHTTNNLMTKYTLAQTTLLSLNKAKDHLERELNVKTNSIKIDEVQCLTLRSTVHYHAY